MNVSHSLVAVGEVGFGSQLYLGHSTWQGKPAPPIAALSYHILLPYPSLFCKIYPLRFHVTGIGIHVLLRHNWEAQTNLLSGSQYLKGRQKCQLQSLPLTCTHSVWRKIYFSHIALRTAKTLLSFGCSECNRVNIVV